MKGLISGFDRMPSSHKEKKGKQVKKEEEDGHDYFAVQLAKLKELKCSYEKTKDDRVKIEVRLYGQETSFINDFEAYQEAAVAAGFIKEENKIVLGRRFSETSSSWLQALKKNPLLALSKETNDLPVKEEEDEMETTKSHKKSADKSRKRKR